jgi:hypothetical protein
VIFGFCCDLTGTGAGFLAGCLVGLRLVDGRREGAGFRWLAFDPESFVTTGFGCSLGFLVYLDRELGRLPDEGGLESDFISIPVSFLPVVGSF